MIHHPHNNDSAELEILVPKEYKYKTHCFIRPKTEITILLLLLGGKTF